MPHLSLRLLGTLQIFRDGIALTGFESDKERALLVYLAEESRQPHRREKLAGLLWPDRTETAARNNLRRVLSNLRRLLGDHCQSEPPALLVMGQTILFNPDCGVWVDSQVFTNLINPHINPSRSELEQAVLLYQGDFMDGFSLADSPEFEEWVVVCRERYQRMMMDVLSKLLEEYESQANFERAILMAWRQLDLEPWWESAHQQLIRLLALSGRRSEALAQYVKCHNQLAEELGVLPSSETTLLYEQIRDETFAGSFAPRKDRPAVTHNLPLTFGPFVGREVEINEIWSWLRDPASRLLTLVGAGGMGKTHLALEAITGWLSRDEEVAMDCVIQVTLDPHQTADTIIPILAREADFQLSPGRNPQAQLLEFLGKKRCLLILDSCENFVDGADFITRILKTSPHVKILVTSRTRLNLQVEQCLPVAGIAFPGRYPEDAYKVRNFAAIELFLQASRRVQSRYEPGEKDLADISHICWLVQGMPLGILLAATWIGLLSPAEIAQEIGKSLDFLETDWGDIPERQRSIRRVLDQSWNMLSVKEQKVLKALSVFCGGFTRAAADAVCGAKLRELKSLADKSLLEYEPTDRYKIHDLLRQFLTDVPDNFPVEKATAGDRHCAYYTNALQRWQTDLFGCRQQEALIEIETERQNIQAAWYWAVEHVKIKQLDHSLEGLESFYWQSGRYQEAEAALQAAVDALDVELKTINDKAACLLVKVRALAWLSNFNRATGKRDDAIRQQQKCVEILNDPRLAGVDTRLESAILSWSIGVTICMQDYAQGRKQFQKSFSLFRELNHRWGMAWALNAWGTMSFFLSDYPDARRRLEHSLATYQELGNQSGIAGSLSRLAGVACSEGYFERAESLARQGYTASQKAGSRTQSALALLDLGEVLVYVANFTEAYSVVEQSLMLLTDFGHLHYITQAHSLLSSIHMHRGTYQLAREQAETGLIMAKEYGPRFCMGQCLLLLGCLDLVEGSYASASQYLLDGVAVLREVGQKGDMSLGFACLSLAANGLGDIDKAWKYLYDAIKTASELHAIPQLLWALPAMSLLTGCAGEVERAVELSAMASQFPFVARSRWFGEVVWKPVTSFTTTLPSEQVDILMKHGQARDLKATAYEFLIEVAHQFNMSL